MNDRVEIVFGAGLRQRHDLGLADVHDFPLDRGCVQPIQRQADEGAHPAHDLAEDGLEGAALLFVAALHGGWVFKAPVRSHRVSGPDGAGLARGLVADGENKVHLRRIGRGELVPAFAAQGVRRVADAFELFDGVGVDYPARMAARAIGLEAALAQGVDQSLAHDRARGIAGAQHQYVVNLVHEHLQVGKRSAAG